MDKRNDIEIIINHFLACTIQPIEFIEDLLYDLDSFEKKENLIIDLKRFLKSNKLNSSLKSFYENQIQSIPIDSGLIKNKDMTSIAHLEEIEILRTEAFDKRVKELNSLSHEVLEEVLDSFRNSDKKIKLISGLNYQGKAKNQLENFHRSLINHKYIDDIRYAEFSKFFKKEFKPNENKLFWKTNLNDLYYLFMKIRKYKNTFIFKRNNYRDILPFMFLWENEEKEIVALDPKTFSQNNKKPNNTSLLDKIFEHLL
ncbi:MAG TPA: hypothetical protein PKW80_11320 [Bacteroidales bacterium]|nr:hypothetical protein [Bacteroidales bacterium]